MPQKLRRWDGSSSICGGRLLFDSDMELLLPATHAKETLQWPPRAKISDLVQARLWGWCLSSCLLRGPTWTPHVYVHLYSHAYVQMDARVCYAKRYISKMPKDSGGRVPRVFYCGLRRSPRCGGGQSSIS